MARQASVLWREIGQRVADALNYEIEYILRHKPRRRCDPKCPCECHEIGMGHAHGLQCFGKMVWPNTWQGHYAEWTIPATPEASTG